MIALRLVRLIESHSEELAESLLHKLERSSRAADLKKVPGHEIRERVHEVYRNLSDWLLTKTDDDVERVYVALGRRRAEQGVSMSALCWAIIMIEENLGNSLRWRACGRSPWRSSEVWSCCACWTSSSSKRCTLPRWAMKATGGRSRQKNPLFWLTRPDD